MAGPTGVEELKLQRSSGRAVTGLGKLTGKEWMSRESGSNVIFRCFLIGKNSLSLRSRLNNYGLKKTVRQDLATGLSGI